MTGRLAELGWTPARARELAAALDEAGSSVDRARCEPGRAVTVIRHLARLALADGDADAFIPGKLRAGSGPVVGDWVVVERPQGVEPVVRAVLPRTTKLSRKVAGARTEEQVLAANVDTVFLVMGLDGDFNLRRLERLSVVVHQSGARPVVVLTKRDLVDDDDAVAERRARVAEVAPGVPAHAVSSPRREGLEPLRVYLAPGETVVLLGSSGAGKSTLLNTLVGKEVMRTGAVRPGDDRGRHTTSHRELVPLPGGGLLIDGPGLREIQLWTGDTPDEAAALEETFADVEELAAACRFRDCTHGHEPGCAVRRAVKEGALDASRLENYLSLQRELASLERRKDQLAQRRFERQRGKLYKRIQEAKNDRRK